MTATIKRIVFVSTAVVLSIAPALLSPSAAEARSLPVGAVVAEVVSSVQESMGGPVVQEPLGH